MGSEVCSYRCYTAARDARASGAAAAAPRGGVSLAVVILERRHLAGGARPMSHEEASWTDRR